MDRQSRDLILSHVESAENVTLSWARDRPRNWGIHLLVAGTKQLLASVNTRWKEIGRKRIDRHKGDLIVICGGGWWEGADGVTRALSMAERQFSRVLVMPCTLDPAHEPIWDAIRRSRATILARDCRTAESFDLPLAQDAAFAYDYRPWLRDGEGTLLAYRGDREASGGAVPDGAEDISETAPSMRAWLERIAGSEEVHTDRTHVMIAAALMGKRVRYRDSAYWKNTAVAETWLSGYQVTRMDAT